MAYERIVSLKKIMSLSLSALLILGILGFLGFSTQFKNLVVFQIIPGLSLGLAGAIGIILFAGILAFCYALWMNYVYDKAMHQINSLQDK